MMDWPLLSEVKINQWVRCCKPVLLQRSSLCFHLILLSIDVSYLYLDIVLIASGVAKCQFCNYVILPAIITWNSSIKTFFLSTIWLP